VNCRPSWRLIVTTSALLLLLVGIAWLMHGDETHRSLFSSKHLYCTIENGRDLSIGYQRGADLRAMVNTYHRAWGIPYLLSIQHFGGTSTGSYPNWATGPYEVYELSIHFYPLIYPLIAINYAILIFIAYRLDRARRSGASSAVCPICGYDLRATPNRCPECGSVPKPA
jgi:hypothetical protein